MLQFCHTPVLQPTAKHHINLRVTVVHLPSPIASLLKGYSRANHIQQGDLSVITDHFIIPFKA